MAISNYLADKLNNHVLRNDATWTQPATVYAILLTGVTGLVTNNPTSELSGNGYLRQIAAFDASSGGIADNTSNIEFPAATGADWTNVTHVAIVDHATNTTWGTNVNVLFFGALTTTRTVSVGQVFRFLAGELDSTFT